MNVINEMGALPTRNHRDVQFEEAAKISGEAMHEKRPTDGKAQLVTNARLLRLHHRLRPHLARSTRRTSPSSNNPKYWGASGGLEYEAAWALGAANGVGDLEALHYANMLCNEDGHGPDLLRRHGRRGDGALRNRAPDQGADRHRSARSARPRRWRTSPRSPRAARASARNSARARSGCAPSTATPSCR